VASLRAVVVDDEEPARELLRSLLATVGDVEIVGEESEGHAALALIRAAAPDIVFLDVQMPGLNGLEIAAAIASADPAPLIVFVTAYDEYAIRAFEVSACDYLLKPFDADRLAAAVARALARRTSPNASVIESVRALVASGPRASNEPIVMKADGRHVFLQPDEIEWVEAVGKEARVHLAAGALVVRESMTSIEGRLDPLRFLRVHRSAIVNRGQIREIQPWFKGDYVLILRRGTRVVTGRTYRSAIQRLLNGGRAPGQ
jgi:two-component system LytT family response regulator